MLKKTITYTDYDGNERTEDFYFNLSKAELTEMQLSESGGWDKMVKRLLNKQDVPEIMKVIKEMIVKSYGEKSDDGKYFRKSPEMSEAFTQTEAYGELLYDIVSSEESASAFIMGVIPANLREAATKELAKQKDSQQ